MKKKVVLKASVIKAIILILFIILLISGCNLIHWKHDVKKNNKIKKQLNNYITINENEKKVKDRYVVDFNSIKKLNNDTIAYLNVNNTKIDYIVVRGEDNQYYLNHNFNKKKNIAGWIYSDYNNKFDGNDKNIVIYGKNMKDGSMFGTLNKVLNKKWQENKDNLKIVLVTERKAYEYQIFSTYTTSKNDYLKTKFSSNEEYADFLETIKENSNYDYNISVSPIDRILTLTTSIGKKNVVVHAKKVIN